MRRPIASAVAVSLLLLVTTYVIFIAHHEAPFSQRDAAALDTTAERRVTPADSRASSRENPVAPMLYGAGHVTRGLPSAELLRAAPRGLLVQRPTPRCRWHHDHAERDEPSTPTPFERVASVDCPAFRGVHMDDSDTVTDRRSTWVIAKYKYYATRCNRTHGLMWSKLTKKSHDRIVNRVMGLYFGRPLQTSSAAAVADDETAVLLNRRLPDTGTDLTMLDWACGCGVSLDHIAHLVSSLSSSRAVSVRRFYGLGIDLTEAAIAYARSTFLRDPDRLRRQGSDLRYCHADGTDLAWLPPASFDLITAFGGLLHLPAAFMCSSLRRLVTLLKPGHGMLWAGYIDNAQTRAMLVNCTFECSPKLNVTVTVLSENVWWKGVGIPVANRKLKPVSIVWERRWSDAAR